MQLKHTENAHLSLNELPATTSSNNDLEKLALTFDGYSYWHDKPEAEYDENCGCLAHLRTRLFMAQRAGRHGYGIDRDLALKLIERIDWHSNAMNGHRAVTI